jgi:hypothetical protein
MTVDDLDRMCVSVAPSEAYPPLVVDPERILSGPVGSQLFEAMAWNTGKLFERNDGMQSNKLLQGTAPNICRNSAACATREQCGRFS